MGGASLLELTHWYRTRVMWFDKTRVRVLTAARPAGRRRHQYEDILAHGLALYLFDQDHPVFVKADIANVQLDLVGVAQPLLVEAKAYRDGSAKTRRGLIAGVAQVHAYLVDLEASRLHVVEAYDVLFRLDGPIFDLPSRIPTNRFTIYPVVIDAGASDVSGRHQPPPAVISLDEVLAALHRPRRPRAAPVRAGAR